MKLIPVDYDPFTQPQLRPVEHNPFEYVEPPASYPPEQYIEPPAARLVPVDHDPFDPEVTQ